MTTWDGKPALTEEEWAKAKDRGILKMVNDPGDASWETVNDFPCFVEGDSNHALAAIRLKDQPYGFTAEMVEALGDALSSSECDYEVGRLADQAIKNIAALLPKE